MIGERSRVSTFVVLQATRIPDAESVHCSPILPCRQRCDRTRIETTTQCDPHRHVRTNHDLANGFKLLADQHRWIAFDRRRVFHPPISIRFDLSRIDIDDQERRSIELAHTSQWRQRLWHVLIMKIKIDRAGIELKRYETGSQQRLHLGREEQAVVLLIEIERFLPHAVAAEYEPFALRIPQSERKHAAQVLNEIEIVFFVKVKNRFAVAVGVKTMTLPFEAFT